MVAGDIGLTDNIRVKKLARVESVESVDARLEEMERKMDRLRVLYENFFMGVERTPPNVPRRELNRLMLETQQTPIANATMRFRFQTLLQRWVLLTTYWNRTLREIESGVYRKDLARANRHLAARNGAPMTEDEALRMGIPASRAKSFIARHNKQAQAQPGARATATAPDAGAPGRSAAGSSAPLLPGLREGALEDFYQRYVKAHIEAVGAPPKATLDQVRAKLQQDLPRILADKRCDRIELDLAVDNGKVRLKARPAK